MLLPYFLQNKYLIEVIQHTLFPPPALFSSYLSIHLENSVVIVNYQLLEDNDNGHFRMSIYCSGLISEKTYSE